MNHRDHQRLVAEVGRLRPVAVVVLAAVAVLPSLWEAATGNLSPVAVLGRLALALPVFGALVWITSGVVLHYARVQVVRSEPAAERNGEIEP